MDTKHWGSRSSSFEARVAPGGARRAPDDFERFNTNRVVSHFKEEPEPLPSGRLLGNDCAINIVVRGKLLSLLHKSNLTVVSKQRFLFCCWSRLIRDDRYSQRVVIKDETDLDFLVHCL